MSRATSAKLRNTPLVVRESRASYERAIGRNLMQVTINGRSGKRVLMPDGKEVTEFVNCSYLGLDLDPRVIAASQSVDASWGMNFCCARSRLSIEPQRRLEEELSELYRGRAIAFPSTTAAHLSVMPLLAAGLFFEEHEQQQACLIFDQFAHSSMQYLKPVLASEATVKTIPHNSLDDLRLQVLQARERSEVAVYVADGVYSMGGSIDLPAVLSLARELDFYLYVDDAHGTAIFGERGEGFALDQLPRDSRDRLFLTFSLSKGFGAYGGGVLLPAHWQECLVRSYGQVYGFSAAMNFSAVAACRAVVQRHYDGTIQHLQSTLRSRVAQFDGLMGTPLAFSPIRMLHVGDEQLAIQAAEELLKQGYYLPVAFFPAVRRGAAQLRVLIAANHTPQDLEGLAAALDRVKDRFGICSTAGKTGKQK